MINLDEYEEAFLNNHSDWQRRLADIPGLDITRGLQSVCGKKLSYLRLLRILVDYHGSDPQQLGASLAEGDLMEVGRLAHTLKGAAGNFGALRIQAMAGELELAIEDKAPRVEVERLTAALATELAALINAVKLGLPTAGEAKSWAAADGDRFHNPHKP